jgi:hypothetical protein
VLFRSAAGVPGWLIESPRHRIISLPLRLTIIAALAAATVIGWMLYPQTRTEPSGGGPIAERTEYDNSRRKATQDTALERKADEGAATKGTQEEPAQRQPEGELDVPPREPSAKDNPKSDRGLPVKSSPAERTMKSPPGVSIDGRERDPSRDPSPPLKTKKQVERDSRLDSIEKKFGDNRKAIENLLSLSNKVRQSRYWASYDVKELAKVLGEAPPTLVFEQLTHDEQLDFWRLRHRMKERDAWWQLKVGPLLHEAENRREELIEENSRLSEEYRRLSSRPVN